MATPADWAATALHGTSATDLWAVGAAGKIWHFTARLPRCGDGALQASEGEECDDGNLAPGDGCGPTCLFERCGNAFLDPGEECDDGNTASGDDCSATCTCEVPESGRFAQCAGTSCQQILQDGLSRGSGVYWLDPAATGTAFQTYCDMVTAGGGWTLVATYGTDARPATWSGSSYPRPGAAQYGTVSTRIFEAANNGTDIANFSIDAADLWTLSSREVLAYVGGTTDDYVTGQLPAGCNFFDGSTWCAESTYGPFEVRRSNGTTLTANGYACTTAHRAAPYAADAYDEFGLHLLDGLDNVAGYNCQGTASTLGHQGLGRIFTSFNQASGGFWNFGIHSHWAPLGLGNQPGALLVR